MSKQFKGLWIPAEVLCNEDLKHVEKLVLSMALAMRDGIRMSDATIAEQIGVSDRSIAGILKSLVSKDYMGKSGSGYYRKFTPLRKAATLTTQGCDHKEYKEYKKNKQNAKKVEKKVDEALELDSSNTSEASSLGTKPSWHGFEDTNGYALRNEPKEGTLIRNPHTGEITEYEK